MRRNLVIATALLSLAAIALSGCGAAKSVGTGAQASSGGAAAKEPYYIEKPYPTIVPESPNEKKAAESTGKALETYIANAKLQNKQNKRDDKIFDNHEGYVPRFVGYGFVLVTGKLSDGKYRTLDISYFDGQVKPLSTWDRFGSIAKGDGIMNDSFYAGVATTMDPTSYMPAIKPVSTNEKAAQAAVESWVKKNLDPGFTKVVLSTYMFLYGERGDKPTMMMSIAPNGFSYNSVISWGKTQ